MKSFTLHKNIFTTYMLDKDKIYKKLGRPKCTLVITTYDDKGNPLIQEFEGVREARDGTGLSIGTIYNILKNPRENCKIEKIENI